jgi:hypothetical protein
MRYRLILPLAALLATMVVAPAAQAKARVGLSEQSPALFSQANWQKLKLKRVRYIVSWDYAKRGFEQAEVAGFLNSAHAAGQDVLVEFNARRGCFTGTRYKKTKACRAPSQSAYKKVVRSFRAEFPFVKTFAPWNEVNHLSQPTYKKPKLAAAYYKSLKSVCKGCTIVAADVLDSSNVSSYLRSFQRYSKHKGRIWGLHNYKDVNRHQSRGLTNVLKTVPGQVWLTETGGIVTFLPSFKTSISRASSATKYMFQLADRFDSKKKGYKSKVTRIYVYRWWGEPDGTFDSGLVNPDGTPRPAFAQFARYAKSRLK